MATQPVINSVAQPWPYKFKRTRLYRGGAAIMADGSQVTDLVQSGAKHNWAMSWVAISSANLATIVTAFDALKASSAGFTDLDNGSYTVVLDGMAELDIEAVLTANGIRYNCELKLREA